MINEQKIIGMLQAKSLNCLDAEDNKEFQEFIDAGHVFPWEELGNYQNVASLLPLALVLELPDVELKDRVALKLIKLSEQLRNNKILEEDKFEVEEELDENGDDFTNIPEPFVEPEIEIENEETVVEENLVETLNPEENISNLDEAILPDLHAGEVSDENLQDDLNAESPFETLIDETEIDYPQVEEVPLDQVLAEPERTKTPEIQDTIGQEQLAEKVKKENKPTEEPEEQDKQIDWTKKSVVEKMYKAIEMDFDSLKYHYEESERKTTRGLLYAYIIIAVLLALLIFSFFKFSSDINVLENEVKHLNKKLSSSLFYEQKSKFDYYFFS